MKKRILLFTLCLFVLVVSAFVLSSCGEEEYTITFDADGGSEIKSQIVIEGNKITPPTPTTKTGYEFDGWYWGDEKWSFAGYTVTSDMTLKAKWIPVIYTATFKADGEIVEEIEFTVETVTLNAPSVPAKQCYTGKWDYYSIDSQDITVNAIYTLEHSSLTHIPVKYPECHKTGNIEYWSCTGCDKYFSDATGETEITNKTDVIIPAAPCDCIVTYEEYLEMSSEDKYSYYLSFINKDDFFAWYNNAKAEYDAKKDRDENFNESVDL